MLVGRGDGGLILGGDFTGKISYIAERPDVGFFCLSQRRHAGGGKNISHWIQNWIGNFGERRIR